MKQVRQRESLTNDHVTLLRLFLLLPSSYSSFLLYLTPLSSSVLFLFLHLPHSSSSSLFLPLLSLLLILSPLSLPPRSPPPPPPRSPPPAPPPAFDLLLLHLPPAQLQGRRLFLTSDARLSSHSSRPVTSQSQAQRIQVTISHEMMTHDMMTHDII